jgi:hypothetical protein
MGLLLIVRASFNSPLLIHVQHLIEDLQRNNIQVRNRVLPSPLDLPLRAKPLKLLLACKLALPITLMSLPTFSPTTRAVLH